MHAVKMECSINNTKKYFNHNMLQLTKSAISIKATILGTHSISPSPFSSSPHVDFFLTHSLFLQDLVNFFSIVSSLKLLDLDTICAKI